MIPKVKDKPKIVIAGPGAGKTHDMVNRIIEAMPDLKPNRILAAITFTNSATDSIREKLKNLVQIPPNVFVGTTYSFYNKFIFLPFASLFNYVADDKCFLELDIRKIVDKILKGNQNPKLRNFMRKKILIKLLNEGKVPFEQIASISAKLIENTKVREVVSNRIQFLFNDEFQDTDTTQFKVFRAIIKAKKTKIYAVGDPEQYILGYTYDTRNIKKPLFQNIPINKSLSCSEDLRIKENKRACDKLVDFTNNFHSSLDQISKVGHIENTGVFFIEDTNLGAIISKYINKSQIFIDSDKDSKRLFLGYANKTYNGFIEKYRLTQISNDNKRQKSIIKESLELMSTMTQLSHSKLKDKLHIDEIRYRKMGIQILKAIRSGNIKNVSELAFFLKKELGFEIKNGDVNLENKLEGLIKLLRNKYNGIQGNNYYSSIHKAKGLEAECVLVVSKSQNELNKWIETDFNKRYEDKTDTCRIGYVGFTRAKKILCIGCQKTLDKLTKQKLTDLNVKFL